MNQEIIVLKKSTSLFTTFKQYIKSSSFKCSNSNGKQMIDEQYLFETVDKSDFIVLVTNNFLNRETRSGKTATYNCIFKYLLNYIFN